MITAGGGGAGGGNPSFIAVSSIAGHTASPTYPFYFASKHGLHGFIRSMGMLRDAVGVRFGAVAPGAVKVRNDTPPWPNAHHIASKHRSPLSTS